MSRLRRSVLHIALLSSLFGVEGALLAQKEGIIGMWTGTVTEGKLTYSLVMKIERLEPRGYAGTTTYSGSANCGGLLTFRRQRAGLYEFDETINTGRGCANGRIEAYITSDGLLEWEWYHRGKGEDPASRATLSPLL